MKYTKKQRHEIYLQAYGYLLGRQYAGSECICASIAAICFKDPSEYDQVTEELFPEFWSLAPQDNLIPFALWSHYAMSCDSKQLRQTILEFCIEMTKP